MTLTTLDQITRRNLLEKGLPLHFYLEYMLHAATCLRELTISTLHIVRAKVIKINSYNAITLPDDFSDDIMLSISTGATLWVIPKRDDINPIRSIDSNGNYVPYPTVYNLNGMDFWGYNPNWVWFWNINDLGEPTGRFFGAGGGDLRGYQVFRERNEIQLVGPCSGDSVVLLYISDGQSADDATQVEIVAINCIQRYQNWMTSPNRDNINSPEGRTYVAALRELRARKDDLTPADIKNIVRTNFKASMKN